MGLYFIEDGNVRAIIRAVDAREAMRLAGVPDPERYEMRSESDGEQTWAMAGEPMRVHVLPLSPDGDPAILWSVATY